MTTAPALEGFIYDPFSPEVMRDPLPFYEMLREHFPVYYAEPYDTFFLSRFQDAWDFLTMPENVFVTNEGSVMTRAEMLRHNDGPTSDGPTTPLGSHLRYGAPVYDVIRKAHTTGLRPQAVMRMEPFLRDLVRARLAAVLPQGRFDLVREFGGIVSASAICHLFRIPLEEAADVLDTVNALSRTDNDEPGFANRQENQKRLMGFIIPRVKARRAEGADGSWPLVDGLLNLEFDGRRLNTLEVAVNLTCVFAGGTETLPKIVAHGLLELVRHPEQLAAVRDDLTANCRTALEEMNRFCGPAQWFGRTARERATVAGQVVEPGQRVVYLTQSANRDPREFERPEVFRWDRQIKRTLAFGRGQHFCSGVHIARLEGRIILEEFLAAVPEYGVDLSTAERPPSNFQWGYSRLDAVVPSAAEVVR